MKEVLYTYVYVLEKSANITLPLDIDRFSSNVELKMNNYEFVYTLIIASNVGLFLVKLHSIKCI